MSDLTAEVKARYGERSKRATTATQVDTLRRDLIELREVIDSLLAGLPDTGIAECWHCGGPLPPFSKRGPVHKRRKWCSVRCRNQGRRHNPYDGDREGWTPLHPVDHPPRICAGPGCEELIHRRGKRFCSSICSSTFHNQANREKRAAVKPDAAKKGPKKAVAKKAVAKKGSGTLAASATPRVQANREKAAGSGTLAASATPRVSDSPPQQRRTPRSSPAAAPWIDRDGKSWEIVEVWDDPLPGQRRGRR